MAQKYILPFPEPEHRRFINSVTPSVEGTLDDVVRGYSYERHAPGSFVLGVPRGTPITASRRGNVTYVEHGRILHRILPLALAYHQRAHETNLVVVKHSDGSYARYTHVLPDVEAGQVVNAGERLGIVGGYAFMTLPHVHVEMYKLQRGERVPLSVAFSGIDDTRRSGESPSPEKQRRHAQFHRYFELRSTIFAEMSGLAAAYFVHQQLDTIMEYAILRKHILNDGGSVVFGMIMPFLGLALAYASLSYFRDAFSHARMAEQVCRTGTHN